MIDVARHFIPMDVLKRNVDAMAAVKMNVLHLHLTDDEGFRIESKKYPLFHQKGSDGLYYTQEEMKGLIEYARLRGIMIVPEFDMPGHTRSWFAAYPQLASAPGPYKPGPRFTIGEKDTTINLAAVLSAASPTIDPTREEVYTLLGGLLAEMAALFPAPFMHIGADENNGAAWRQNPKIMAFMQQKGFKDTHALQAYFVSRLYTMVKKHQKTMIGWEELYGPGLAKDVVVHKWIADGGFMKTSGTPAQIAEAGNPVLVSVGFCLDHFMPAYIHYLNPSLPAATHPNIWGGIAAMWTEIADAGTIETRIWPRTAAIAERLWSDAQRKDTDDMYRRLFAVSRQLDERGLQHVTSYEQGLRRLSGTSDPGALRRLADVLTPIKGYKNLFSRINEPARLVNNKMALAALADILPVDSETKRVFRSQVARYLRSRAPEDAAAIRAQLAQWASTHKALSADPALAHSLGPVMTHAENLTALALIGQQAIDWIEKGQAIPDTEQKAMLARISASRKPQAETELDITLEIESLVKQQLLAEPASYNVF
jgi:hexosaminidase